MKKTILFILLLFPISQQLQAQDSTLVSLQVGNSYKYKYSYYWHGGHSGNGFSFQMDITSDTVVENSTYYVAELNGKIKTEYFPWIANGDSTIKKEFLLSKDSSSFEIYDMKLDSLLFSSDSLEVTSNSEEIFGDSVSTKIYFTRDIYGVSYNTFEVAENFGLVSFMNAEGFGENNINLYWARINGVEYGDSTTVSNEPELDIPNSFKLGQNYPNPFNPSTTIPVSISSPGNVKLEVFDVMGRNIATLHHGNLQTGEYQFTFSSQSLSSGVYYYVLTVDDNLQVKKMTLLK